MKQFVLLLTGLSGSGKSTLAKTVADELRKSGIPAEIIDGDESRGLIGNILGHDKESRMKMGKINCAIGHYLVRNKINVIYALVCPYEEIRKMFRDFFGELYIEAYVKASRKTCAERDVKGLYKLSENGMLENLNGTNDDFEIPGQCNLIVDTERLNICEAGAEIVGYLRENNRAT